MGFFPLELRTEEEKKAAIKVPDENNVADYYEVRQQLDELNKDLVDVITHPNYSVPFLNTGRLVHIKHNGLDFGWGVILNYQKKVPASKVKSVSAASFMNILIDVAAIE
jgi:ATP-dependent RNA helicase DOB1